MNYWDAHNHLNDSRLDAARSEILEELSRIGVSGAVVNGTREDDWGHVSELAFAHPWLTPSFGLHPWFVDGSGPDWNAVLQGYLDKHPTAGIGEIGLDRWIENHDIHRQNEVFRAQLDIAAERDLPVTIHCLKAWGALWDIIQSVKLPRRGFLLHSYSGPAEMVAGFAKYGAYFSFSPYFLETRKERTRDVFRHIPRDRLLIETDAPDMKPPEAVDLYRLMHSAERINHPGNIILACKGLAETLLIPDEEVSELTHENFRKLFLA